MNKATYYHMLEALEDAYVILKSYGRKYQITRTRVALAIRKAKWEKAQHE